MKANEFIIDDSNRDVFEVFCNFYPHEAFSLNQEEFLKYMKKQHPSLTQEKIIEILKTS